MTGGDQAVELAIGADQPGGTIVAFVSAITSIKAAGANAVGGATWLVGLTEIRTTKHNRWHKPVMASAICPVAAWLCYYAASSLCGVVVTGRYRFILSHRQSVAPGYVLVVSPDWV